MHHLGGYHAPFRPAAAAERLFSAVRFGRFGPSARRVECHGLRRLRPVERVERGAVGPNGAGIVLRAISRLA